MRCIHCGKTTEGTFVYCPHCGKRRPKTIDEMKVEIEHEQAKRKRSGGENIHSLYGDIYTMRINGELLGLYNSFYSVCAPYNALTSKSLETE